MKLIITKDYDHLSEVSADFIAQEVLKKNNLAWCAPTGSTPIGMYQTLVKRVANKSLDLSSTRICNMDEYVGLAPTHDQSYNYFLHHYLLDHIEYDKENSVFVHALADDLHAECVRYNQALDKLTIDLAIDGIGLNGHLAFNEPSPHFHARTHIAQLTQNTIDANSRFFDNIDDVPKQAFSIGMADLMMAKTLLLLANGKHKAEVIAKIFSDDLISSEFPVSFIKMHPNCVIIIDQDAASLLPMDDLGNLSIQLEVTRLD